MKKHLMAAAAAVALMTPMAAHAVEVIIDPLSAVWQNSIGGSAVVIGGEVAFPNTATIRWGTPVPSPGPVSGYDFAPVNTPITYDVPPDTPPFLLGEFTHLNFPINGAISGVQLKLTAGVTVGGVSQGDRTFVFDFDHNETPNGANPCANGEANNQGVNINGCADIVVVTNFAQSETFLVDGQEVTLNVLGFLIDGAIVNTFETIEGQTNSAFLFANIGAPITTVPEPASLALLGMGLLGLGYASRRRKAA